MEKGFSLPAKITYSLPEKTRADKFLAQKFSFLPRSFWQKALAQNLVKINNQPATKKSLLREGDRVELAREKIKSLYQSRQPSLAPEDVPFFLIKEEDDYLIIEKPAGLITHPCPSAPQHTLLNGLLKKYPYLKKVGEDPQRPALVHRLDKDVSGLMLIPKNQKAFFYFKKLFQEHKIKKIYTGLVFGQTPMEGKLDYPLIRDKKSGLFKTSSLKKGKEALTLFWAKKIYSHFSLLKIQILTGRTHQIRAHFKIFGHPLVGDSQYFLKQNKKYNLKGLNRIFLHATELSFLDPAGKKQKFISPLPSELKNFLANLE